MRMGTVIALVVVVAVIIGGVVWYADGTGPEEPVTELNPEREGGTDVLPAETAAVPSEVPAQTGDGNGTEAAGASQSPEAEAEANVVGDEIPEDAIVVESATDEPVILDAETADPTILATGADTPGAGGDTAATGAEVDAATGTAPAGAADAGAATDQTGTGATPAELLTPENFDPDAVFDLIAQSEQLSAEERTSLRALVQGAAANPDLRSATIDALRDALDLPPLQ